ncbi:MAG TPA: hypothetical protein VJ738_19955 [Steroidobacteraceae bacterium]|nr:hypothetical protein [Steroidobacteraceae bacterium]
MIKLTFHDPVDTPAVVLEASDFRITGGVLWNHLDHGLIACFASGSWKHRGRYYPSMSISGACCLVFGIARDALISEPISLFSVTGTTFRANGVAIAEYDEAQDLWQGLIRPITWQSMRVVSAGAASALVDVTTPVVLNPWDYTPAEPGPAIPSSK